MWISWKDKDTDLVPPIALEDKIDIFYQQTLGWQLHVADLIANGGDPLGSDDKVGSVPHSGFAVLHICLSYFETIGKYRALASGSRASFKAGAEDVLPELRSVSSKVRGELLDVLYRDARCGLYHNSRTCRGVGLGQPPDGAAMVYDQKAQKLVISPERLPGVLKRHLERYRKELLDPTNSDSRRSFEHRFNEDFGTK